MSRGEVMSRLRLQRPGSPLGKSAPRTLSKCFWRARSSGALFDTGSGRRMRNLRGIAAMLR
jgi:hypothetical protein